MVWKTGRVRIELNGAGIRETLRSEGVQEMLDGVADRVADAANGRYQALPVGARTSGGGETIIKAERRSPGKTATRARSRVVAEHPAALNVEAKHRVLGTSVDAGRTS